MSETRNTQELRSANDDFNHVVQLALEGNKQQLQQWTKSGKSIDIVDEHGRSAVLVVTIRQNMNALRLLVELGADVDLFDAKRSAEVIDPTAFLYSGSLGMNEALELLIAAGAKPDIYNYYGGTALIPAAEKGHVETVRLLLDKSAVDANHINRLGWTALMEAVVLSDGADAHQQIVKLLLAHGADASITDNDGVSVMEHARKRGYVRIIELLER